MIKRNPDNNINTYEMDETDLKIEELKRQAVKESHVDKMQYSVPALDLNTNQ